ncbi:phosphoribosylamine--glycine ligase [Liquorilactobacillus cacaonum]|uniref:phosphoribosylamine--glycine ligase n=1 Tax=Liquorilactobacillus cacaonum TaxID=483012 RepID=UPI000708A563|nr:phosphoribosylamine--glycine ligase [Liquorilactobacillus cacaonum]
MSNKLNLLVVGSGGREHAICKAFSKSQIVENVYCAPGNVAMESSKIKPVSIPELNFEELANFVIANKIDWTFVGPEDALVAGIVDYFKERGLAIFGPNKIASQLEGSKDFALNFMVNHEIPTARYQTFQKSENAIKALTNFSAPIVIKADGLAGGKGVTIANTSDEAVDVIKKMFDNGETQIVLEEFLNGPEYSLFVIVNGSDFQILPMAQDHKRAFDNDSGPNTGGMGAYSPVPQLAQEDYQNMIVKVVEPSIKGLNSEQFDYHGILYIGLILTEQGPKVIEYNVRLGDPETQVVLPRLESDFAQVIDDCINGLKMEKLSINPQACLNVVLAAEGYPTNPRKGQLLPSFTQEPGISIDYANVIKDGDQFYGNGGRILSVVSIQKTLIEAQKKAYSYMKNYEFENCRFRKDIGNKAFKD